MRKVFRGASRRDFQDLFLKVDLWKRRSCLFLSVNRSRYDAWKWLQLWRGPDLIQSQDILDGREKILKEPGFLMTSTGHLMNQTGDCPMCWPVVMWDDKSYCLELLSWVCCSQNEKKKKQKVWLDIDISGGTVMLLSPLKWLIWREILCQALCLP